MTLKIDAKFEEKLICCFKNDKKLVKFDPSTRKCQKFALQNVKGDVKFEEKLARGLKNGMRNMEKFHRSP